MRLSALLKTHEGQKHNDKHTMHNGKSRNTTTNNKTKRQIEKHSGITKLHHK